MNEELSRLIQRAEKAVRRIEELKAKVERYDWLLVHSPDSHWQTERSLQAAEQRIAELEAEKERILSGLAYKLGDENARLVERLQQREARLREALGVINRLLPPDVSGSSQTFMEDRISTCSKVAREAFDEKI